MVSTAKSSTKSAATAVARTSAKDVAPVPAKTPRTAKARATTATGPSLRFYHSEVLREKTNTVLSALESQPGHPHHGEAIADLVTHLIEAGMDYYFLKPLKQAEVGFVAEQSARLGISGAVKLVSSVSRKFITRMDQTQLLVVATHIRSLAVS
ncbi:MAG TPA: hypothetical protein PK440_11205 [Candidatus Accumulibacter phosphatis]|nr:MAG: hypothetical protein AW07_02632 [Candidatus Accumulibacter sp. SK-11]HAY29033.1 hypothetical protein [Accumulibacter sp.]HCN68739.1 hypothetical protein [Accumulibacter sp.]HRL76783.1 hypothetical protein [Candidatus Accumulibacter phosphatis]HRQ95543.1 hypothetical protein [Candidatus Accumulibacter phosphatis]